VSPAFGLLFWMIFSISVIILSLIALIDLLRSHFANHDKLVWTIVVLFVPVIGPILYITIGRKQKV
jgi:uncharacterized membrane protein YozB (DUF420 family)